MKIAFFSIDPQPPLHPSASPFFRRTVKVPLSVSKKLHFLIDSATTVLYTFYFIAQFAGTLFYIPPLLSLPIADSLTLHFIIEYRFLNDGIFVFFFFVPSVYFLFVSTNLIGSRDGRRAGLYARNFETWLKHDHVLEFRLDCQFSMCILWAYFIFSVV